MSGGDIAGIIAASGFVLLVIFIGVPLIKIGKVLDEASDSIRELTKETTPLLIELTETTQIANKQLVKVDVITENLVGVTSDINSVVGQFRGAVSGQLSKVAGVISTIRSFSKIK